MSLISYFAPIYSPFCCLAGRTFHLPNFRRWRFPPRSSRSPRTLIDCRRFRRRRRGRLGNSGQTGGVLSRDAPGDVDGLHFHLGLGNRGDDCGLCQDGSHCRCPGRPPVGLLLLRRSLHEHRSGLSRQHLLVVPVQVVIVVVVVGSREDRVGVGRLKGRRFNM